MSIFYRKLSVNCYFKLNCDFFHIKPVEYIECNKTSTNKWPLSALYGEKSFKKWEMFNFADFHLKSHIYTPTKVKRHLIYFVNIFF